MATKRPGPAADLTGAGAAWGAAFFLWVAATLVRWRALGEAAVDSDALGQFLAAWALLHGHLPAPPNPEAGHALTWWSLPPVALAGSLEGLYRLRFAQAALIAPLTALSCRWLLGSSNRAWAAAVAAGTLVGLDPGLVDTLVVAFRGYGAPELGAVATVGLVAGLRGRAWGPSVMLLALLAAAGQHPMALGLLVGGVAVAPMLRAQVGAPALWFAAGLGLLACLPRLLVVLGQASCGEGWAACLGQVAFGSSEPGLGRIALLGRAMAERVTGDLGVAGAALLGLALASATLRLWGPPRRRDDLAAHAAARWGLGSLVGVLLVGLLVESLRPYHLRVAAAPVALLAAVGLARAWPLAGAFTLLWGALWTGATPTTEVQGAVDRADHLARRIAGVAPPLRVDRVWYEGPPFVEPAGVVLAAVLQGQDPARFSTRSGARQVLLVAGGPASTAAAGRGFDPFAGLDAAGGSFVAAGKGWAALEFPDAAAAGRWARSHARAPYQLGGAWDWEQALHPEDADLSRAAWDLGP